MSYIVLDNGMRIESPDTVKAVEGVVRMPVATITVGGRKYDATDVVIDFTEGSLSYGKSPQTKWRTNRL